MADCKNKRTCKNPRKYEEMVRDFFCSSSYQHIQLSGSFMKKGFTWGSSDFKASVLVFFFLEFFLLHFCSLTSHLTSQQTSINSNCELLFSHERSLQNSACCLGYKAKQCVGSVHCGVDSKELHFVYFLCKKMNGKSKVKGFPPLQFCVVYVHIKSIFLFWHQCKFLRLLRYILYPKPVCLVACLWNWKIVGEEHHSFSECKLNILLWSSRNGP